MKEKYPFLKHKVCASKSLYFQRIRAFVKVYRFACAHFISLVNFTLHYNFSGCVPPYLGRHSWIRWRHRLGHPHADVRMDDRRPRLLHFHRGSHCSLCRIADRRKCRNFDAEVAEGPGSQFTRCLSKSDAAWGGSRCSCKLWIFIETFHSTSN